jgi:hypothetical protein
MNSNMMADGVISLDDRPALEAVKRANSGLDDHEKKTKTVLDRTGREWQVYGDGLVRVTDKSKNSLDRLLQSMERQAAFAGKTGADRMIAERDLLIRKWGQEEQAVKAITAAYDKMIAAEGAGGQSKWAQFGDQIKNAIQNPLQAAGNAVSSLLEKLGPMGAGLAAGAAAFGAIALASFNAAKSLGEYGVQIRDVELRTGMSAKEVGQFGYAAKAVGQDVSIFERMMRGLSQALDENSADGEKARAMLARLHVTLYDATTGGVKPTAQALQDIGAALAVLPAGAERDAAAMALFKRAGLEAIPVMVELGANLKTAKEKGYGPSDEEIERYLRYQRTVTQIATDWAAAVRWMKEAIVPSFDNGPQKIAPATSWIGRARNWMLGAKADGTVGKPAGFLGMGREFPSAPTPFVGPTAPGPTALTGVQQAAVDAALSADTQTGAMRAAQKELEKTQTELKNLQDIGAPWSKVGPLAAKADQEKAAIEGMKTAAEDAKRAAEQLKQFRSSASEFEKKGDEAELDAIGKIYYQRDLLLKQARELKGVEGDIAAIRLAADSQVGALADKGNQKYLSTQLKQAEETAQFMERMMPKLGGKTQAQVDREALEASDAATRDRVDSIRLQSQKDTLNREAGKAQKMVGLSGLTGADAIRATYQIRIDLATQLAVIEAERIVREETGAKQMESIARAQAAVQKDMAEAQEEAAMKQLELQKQQMDGLKKESEGLWHTLLTNPRNFGKQLGSTVHEVVIKPVAEGMAGMTANVLKPIIYGQDGAGGLAGMFKGVFGGGHADPMKMSTDMNTAVTVQNSAALATLTAILAGAMGMAAPTVAMPAGIGGLSLPSISAPAVSGGGASTASFGGGFSPLIGGGAGGIGGGLLTSAGIPTFMGGGAAGRAAGGGFNPLAMVLGGGRSGGGASAPNFAGILKNFKGMNWGGFTHGPDVYSTDANGSDVESQGKITGVNGVAGAALFTGGTMLAQQGLLGSSRGTWGGVAEGTLGGAAIGFQMGGPLGAAIGGGVGLGIGLGEKIAGVESPEAEAKRLIKSLYSVNIDTAMAKQIVGIAQSKYAGHVSIAVRDPDVRKMLELYAAGTGQKFPLSATTPRAGSLAEQGGNLYQQATYTYGVAGTLPSNLPVMGFGNAGGTSYPAPGSPDTSAGMGTTIALNINGQPITPEFVADSSMAALNSSYGRMQQSAHLNLPGLMVGT